MFVVVIKYDNRYNFGVLDDGIFLKLKKKQ